MIIKNDSEKTKKRKKDLQAMYDNYFTCENGVCKYYQDCTTKPIDVGYNSSRTVKVGKYYDLYIDNKPIRILFMGKENPSDAKKTEIESPSYLKDCVLPSGRVNTHYQETYRMLCYMFNYALDDKRKYRYRDDAIVNFFSLTNRYRCALKNVGQRTGVDNTENQYWNCLKLLREEIHILQPTVLILQLSNTKARHIFDDDTQLTEIYVENAEPTIFSPKYNCYVIETIHPCAQNGSWAKIHFPAFKHSVDYLKSIGVLPAIEYDTTDIINKMVKENNNG